MIICYNRVKGAATLQTPSDFFVQLQEDLGNGWHHDIWRSVKQKPFHNLCSAFTGVWGDNLILAPNQFNHEHISKNLACGAPRMWEHLFLVYLQQVCSSAQKASWMLDQEEKCSSCTTTLILPPVYRTSCKQRIRIMKIKWKQSNLVPSQWGKLIFWTPYSYVAATSKKFHLALTLGLVYLQVIHKAGVCMIFLNPLKSSTR